MTTTKQTFYVASFLGAMLIAIFGTGEYLRSQVKGHEHKAVGNIEQALKSTSESSMFQTKTHNNAFQNTTYTAKKRTLEEFYSRRAYPGAPPVIPHPVAKDGVIADSCLSCHQDGGYSPQYNAYAPVTPHPNLENCRQCHASQAETENFQDVSWGKIDPPKLHRPALPGSPPPVPHSLQMRENCLACHSGPAAILEIRTSHPERTHCLQCHVVQETTSVFERPVTQQEQKQESKND